MYPEETLNLCSQLLCSIFKVPSEQTQEILPGKYFEFPQYRALTKLPVSNLFSSSILPNYNV